MKRLFLFLMISILMSPVFLIIDSDSADAIWRPEWDYHWCNSTSQEVTLAMTTKLARGIVNVATGWMEFFRSIYVTSRDKGLAKGLTAGPLQGVLLTGQRTGLGAMEAVFFLVPAPGTYAPFMDRPLVWSEEHEDEGVFIYKSYCEDY